MSFGAVAVLLLFHTIFLCRSAQSYRYAGQVVSHSIKCLEKAGPSPVLIAEMVPSQYRGALIFRTGLKEATDWMMPGKFGEVRTVSFREQLFRVPYECGNDNTGEGKKVLHIKWNESGIIEIN